MALPNYLQAQPDDVLLSVKLRPRASTNQISGPLGSRLRIKVTAPPVDSAANDALVQFLEELLDCGSNCVERVRGRTSRHKFIKLHKFTVKEVSKKLTADTKNGR